jgi:taurine dioxygenase
MPIPVDVGPRVVPRVPDGWDDRPYERFTVHPLSPTIGAELGGVRLDQPIDDELQAEIHRALLEWKVIFFRDQDISQAQQRAFAERWGELEQHPFYKYVQPDQQAEDVVTLYKDALNPGVENEWHHDVTWHRTPSFGAVLRAVEVPAVGGDTLWLDAAAAYDALPHEVKDRIDGMTAVHDWRRTFGLAMPPEVRAELDPRFPAAEHPVVRVHPETGRRTLFVNPIFTDGIVGLPEDESNALLGRLFHEVRRPEFQCRFRWTAGAVAFWDNRATMHYASSDYDPAPRTMDRISIQGDVPYGIAGSGSLRP